MGVLDGQPAIVTGGGQGIGRGIALALASEGAHVAVLGRTLSKLEDTCELVAERGAEAIAVRCDVSKLDDIETAVAEVVSRLGGIRILVNNAQAILGGMLLDISEADIEELWASGPLATLRLMRTCHPYLRDGGSIVNFSSNAAHWAGPPMWAPYGAAKAAIESLTRSAALEWGHDGIRANAIVPMALSPVVEQWRDSDRDAYDAVLSTMPISRYGDCEKDVGRAVVYLTGPDAGMITGTTLAIDGGGIYLR